MNKADKNLLDMQILYLGRKTLRTFFAEFLYSHIKKTTNKHRWIEAIEVFFFCLKTGHTSYFVYSELNATKEVDYIFVFATNNIYLSDIIHIIQTLVFCIIW